MPDRPRRRPASVDVARARARASQGFNTVKLAFIFMYVYLTQGKRPFALSQCDPKNFKLEKQTKEMASLMHLGGDKYRLVLGNHGAVSPRQAKTKTSFPLDVTLRG